MGKTIVRRAQFLKQVENLENWALALCANVTSEMYSPRPNGAGTSLWMEGWNKDCSLICKKGGEVGVSSKITV